MRVAWRSGRLVARSLCHRIRRSSLLYSSHAQGSSETQVQLIFTSKSSKDSRELELISNTYLLRESMEFFQLEGIKASHTTMTGRLSWDTCLSAVFGSQFRELMKEAYIVGNALSCTARIFKAIVRGEPNYPLEDVSSWQFYFEESIGEGFVENTFRWFPELGSAKLEMGTNTEMTILQAQLQYREDIAFMRRRCHCRRCQKGSKHCDSERFCLSIILETIIVLSLALSGMFVAGDLRPTRAGLEIFYSKQLGLRDHDHDHDREEFDPFFYLMRIATGLGEHQYFIHRIFVQAIQIFAGRVAFQQDKSSFVSARSSYGLCLYLDTLCEISLDKERLRRLHVVPGRIERHGRPFDLVADRKVNNEELSEFVKKTTVFTDVSLLCMEKAHSLRVSFMLKGEDGKTTIHMGPADLATAACLALGRVECGGYHCIKLVTVNDTGAQLQKYSLYSKEVHVCQGDHLLQSALLYLGWYRKDITPYKPSDLHSTPDSYRAKFILRTLLQCLQCCFRAVSQFSKDQRIIILA